MTKTRDKLLSCSLKRARVKLPEYGLDLYVQEMNAEQREEYYGLLLTAVTNKPTKKDIAAKILLPSLLDRDGNQVLTDADLSRLVELSPQILTKLTNTLLELSGLSAEFYEAEKKRLLNQRRTSSFLGWLKNLVKA